MERSYSVYFLRDPRTGEVGYIGMSRQPKKRFVEHWNDSYPSPLKKAWFNQLRQVDLKPELHVVFAGLTQKQAIRVESGLIQAWVSNGREKELHQFTRQKLFFRSKSEVLPLIEKHFSQCSQACIRELIAHLQSLSTASAI